jgi:ABC-type sugar transport system substrate-binding protein
MEKPHVLLSLTTEDNDYQQEQSHDAEQTAQKLGMDLRIIYAKNDAIVQSQQLLEAIQNKSNRPNAIVFEPVGTGLAMVAKAAAEANIGWVVMNRDVEYLAELRRVNKSPMFSVSSDHIEVGRIQGRQLARLLPSGGNVLYIQGPASHLAAAQRTQGAMETKGVSINLRMLKGNWTEQSAYDAVTSWLKLSTSREAHISAIAAHDDDMAIGARKAFEAITTGEDRAHWMNVPYLGCDGLPKTGKTFVDRGILQATVHIPPISGQVLQMLAQAFKTGHSPAERTLTVPMSYPGLEKLNSRAGMHAAV